MEDNILYREKIDDILEGYKTHAKRYQLSSEKLLKNSDSIKSLMIEVIGFLQRSGFVESANELQEIYNTCVESFHNSCVESCESLEDMNSDVRRLVSLYLKMVSNLLEKE